MLGGGPPPGHLLCAQWVANINIDTIAELRLTVILALKVVEFHYGVKFHSLFYYDLRKQNSVG